MKMVQEQWLHLKIKFLLVYNMKIVIKRGGLTFGGGFFQVGEEWANFLLVKGGSPSRENLDSHDQFSAKRSHCRFKDIDFWLFFLELQYKLSNIGDVRNDTGDSMWETTQETLTRVYFQWSLWKHSLAKFSLWKYEFKETCSCSALETHFLEENHLTDRYFRILR